MTLDALLLQKLSNWRPAPQQTNQTLSLDHAESGWRVELQADAVDTIGCRLWEVVLTRTREAGSAPGLKEQAEALATRVTGLLEPLRLIEIDGERNVAQLRSQAPARQGEAVHYYEVERKADGRTRLVRYQASNGSKRQREAFTLTHDALAKLVRDFSA